MKNFLLFTLAILIYSPIFSQVIIEENFDSYSSGDRIAVVSGTDWTTWSKSPGSSEDAAISSTFAASPSNALHIVNDNDCVAKLGDKSSGRYSIKFNILIEAGKIGYFNVLQKFAGSNS